MGVELFGVVPTECTPLSISITVGNSITDALSVKNCLNPEYTYGCCDPGEQK